MQTLQLTFILHWKMHTETEGQKPSHCPFNENLPLCSLKITAQSAHVFLFPPCYGSWRLPADNSVALWSVVVTLSSIKTTKHNVTAIKLSICSPLCYCQLSFQFKINATLLHLIHLQSIISIAQDLLTRVDLITSRSQAILSIPSPPPASRLQLRI